MLMDHAATAAIHNMMLVHDGANECQKKHQGLHLDVERLNVGKASEDSRNHLDIIAASTTHLQSQDPHTWYLGAWAHLCSSLQCSQSREERSNICIDHLGMMYNKTNRKDEAP
jgi:hypothetical protein